MQQRSQSGMKQVKQRLASVHGEGGAAMTGSLDSVTSKADGEFAETGSVPKRRGRPPKSALSGTAEPAAVRGAVTGGGTAEAKPRGRRTGASKGGVPSNDSGGRAPLDLPPAPHGQQCSPEWQHFYAAVRHAVSS